MGMLEATIEYGKWFFKEMVNFYVESVLNLIEGKDLLNLPRKISTIMKLLILLLPAMVK